MEVHSCAAEIFAEMVWISRLNSLVWEAEIRHEAEFESIKMHDICEYLNNFKFFVSVSDYHFNPLLGGPHNQIYNANINDRKAPAMTNEQPKYDLRQPVCVSAVSVMCVHQICE